ncbi:MAG: fluoride efflux transporter FluC [Actinomycetes bacterium]
MTPPRLRVAVFAASAGGAIGALARWALTDRFPVGDGFPATVFWINVLGCALLAALPALAAVRVRPWLGVFLGTGVLGGFTTMSAASEQTVMLLEHDRPGTALAYAGGTLVAALGAVWLVDRWTTPAQRALLERDEADE